MPNPTLTWTNTALRSVAVAGTNATVAEMLTAIKAAIDNDSQKWMTSDYNSGNGTLEIKRKGSPTGEQATCRILFFGGQLPHANSVTIPSPTLATTVLYCGMSVDAATTGPSSSYAAAAPYATKFIRGNSLNGSGNLTSAGGPKVSLIECDDALIVTLQDGTTSFTAVAGYLMEDAATGGLHWCVWTSVNGLTNATADNTQSSAGLPSHISIIAPTTQNHGSYWNSTTGTCRMTGRVNGFCTSLTMATNPLAGSSGGTGTLMPIMVTDGTLSSGSAQSFFGYLRQIRLGPHAQHLQTLRNLGVVQAIHFGPPNGATGMGIWVDQAA